MVVESWCNKCSTCAQVKEPTKARMQQYNVCSLFKRIALDIVGRFSATKDGNKHIMIISHSFSKWPKAYAITNQEATTVARVLVDNWICTFGVPMEMHSNQGRNFESKLFQRVIELFGIRKTRSTPCTRSQISDRIVDVQSYFNERTSFEHFAFLSPFRRLPILFFYFLSMTYLRF